MKPADIRICNADTGEVFLNGKEAEQYCRFIGYHDAQRGAITQCAMNNANKPEGARLSRRYGIAWNIV